MCLCRSSLFLVWDLLGAASDLNYRVNRSTCCWSLDQYYMKHTPWQGRIGLGSLSLVPQNDLKTRVLRGKTPWLVSEMWCVGCFDRNFLKHRLIRLGREALITCTRTGVGLTKPSLSDKNWQPGLRKPRNLPNVSVLISQCIVIAWISDDYFESFLFPQQLLNQSTVNAVQWRHYPFALIHARTETRLSIGKQRSIVWKRLDTELLHNFWSQSGA